MGRFDGSKGVILGVANDHSIAWAIARELLREGAQCGFSHLPDRPDDERQRNRRRVSQLTDAEPNAKFLVPMDACNDDDIAAVMKRAAEEFGTIDFLVHSIAFAPMADLKGDTTDCSREGFESQWKPALQLAGRRTTRSWNFLSECFSFDSDLFWW